MPCKEKGLVGYMEREKKKAGRQKLFPTVDNMLKGAKRRR